MLPKNLKVSGKPCDRAHSRTLTTRCCSGWSTRPCTHTHKYNNKQAQHPKREGTNLLSHWFRISDSCAEVAVPLQPAIQTCPVVVAVSSVRQAPRNKGSKLLVLGVTRLSLCTRTHASQSLILSFAVLLVMVCVFAVANILLIGHLRSIWYGHNSQLLGRSSI